MKTIWVTGAHRSLNEETRQATRAIGGALAREGFGLTTTSWPGVDRETSDAYLAALGRLGKAPVNRYTQVHHRRLWPFHNSTHSAQVTQNVTVRRWTERRLMVASRGNQVWGWHRERAT